MSDILDWMVLIDKARRAAVKFEDQDGIPFRIEATVPLDDFMPQLRPMTSKEEAELEQARR